MDQNEIKSLAEGLKKILPLPCMAPEIFEALKSLMPMVAMELLVTRKEGGFGLKKKKVGEQEGWALPGGFVGLNETFEKAGERIAEKELGIKVAELKFLSVFNWPEGSVRPTKGHAVTLLFKCMVKEPSDRMAYFRQIPERVLPHHKIMLKQVLDEV